MTDCNMIYSDIFIIKYDANLSQFLYKIYHHKIIVKPYGNVKYKGVDNTTTDILLKLEAYHNYGEVKAHFNIDKL